MNALEQSIVQRVIDRAVAAGVPVPEEISAIRDRAGEHTLSGARLWLAAHPEDQEVRGCCWGEIVKGPEYCLCWEPVFDVNQQPPSAPLQPGDIMPAPAMCGDCAYRPGSPERQLPGGHDELLDLAASGQAFYCHTGMRRPTRWEHPDGRAVAGSPNDWQPPMVGGVPYRVDGSPGLLCAGWAAVAARSLGCG